MKCLIFVFGLVASLFLFDQSAAAAPHTGAFLPDVLKPEMKPAPPGIAVVQTKPKAEKEPAEAKEKTEKDGKKKKKEKKEEKEKEEELGEDDC